MHTVVVVLNVGRDQIDEFESGFREQELPVWEELHGRGALVRASLTRLEITSHEVDRAQQYLVIAQFHEFEGHHEHDSHPGFRAWDERAEAFQVDRPFVFGGESLLQVGG